MTVKKVQASTFWQTTFIFTFIANLVILIWSIARWSELKVIMWRSVWIIPLGLYLAALAGCIYLFIWIRKGNAGKLLDMLGKFPGEHSPAVTNGLRVLAIGIFTSILFLIPYLKFSFRVGEVVKKSTQDPVLTMIVFYWVVWWLLLAAAGALKAAFKTSWPAAFAGALITLSLSYEVFIRFQLVTTYPFSMGWSEASRFYYGSLYFAQTLYGFQIPLPTLHPTRYFLQSLPFLFPGLGLPEHRFWQFLLWMVLTGLAAGSIAWRVFGSNSKLDSSQNKKPAWLALLFAGWLFLLLLRVGVYYHLQPMIFIPLWFVSTRHPWRSLAAIIFASAWAGVSRVNWFPVPAMIAIAIYLLEVPYSQSRKYWRYLSTPALWGLAGILSALTAQAVYIPLSGNAQNALAFASSFTSAKLWYRLWPNDSYPLGILPAILIVAGPLILILLLATMRQYKHLHPIRWLGLWGLLLVLFAGGLVVSVKIGGGGDLHNMDAFAALLAVVTAYWIGEKVTTEDDLPGIIMQSSQQGAPWPVIATGLLIPLIFLIPQLTPPQRFNHAANLDAFNQLKSLAEKAGQDGPVLFINERHLLTFHQINLPLVPEYEAVFLMEMAMSNNQAYLQRFYSDLKNHRFAAIVTGKLNVGIKEEGAFAEENNTWNQHISPYILCYYEPVTVVTAPEPMTYIEADESRIEVYLPAEGEQDTCRK